MRLLLVEDDRLLAEGVIRALKADGYTVDWVASGTQATAALDSDAFDLVLLDLGLPGMDGLAVLQQVRGADNPVPVIVVSARDQLGDRVSGLDAGADDYLVKPFDLAELRARIRARLRRPAERESVCLSVGELTIYPDQMTVEKAGERVALSRREFSLLHEFARNPGRVLTRERLEQALYGWSDDVESNALEVHIHHLRRKLGADCIQTVRGVGYRMMAT